jgi:hypothetical protein
MLNSAVKDELIAANPALGANKPALSDGPVKVWEPEHVRTFLMRCSQHRLGALFETAVLTGTCDVASFVGSAGPMLILPPQDHGTGAAGSVFAARSLSRRRSRPAQGCVGCLCRMPLWAHC